MIETFGWVAVVLIWVFGWAAVWLLRKRAIESQRLERRRMLHAERLAAIDKGVDLPELALDDEVPAWLAPEVEQARARWLSRLALLLGLLATTTGVGVCLGFYWSPDSGFHELWTVGLIPLLGGFGLLLFWRLTAAADPQG